jgi:hypothetical protein
MQSQGRLSVIQVTLSGSDTQLSIRRASSEESPGLLGRGSWLSWWDRARFGAGLVPGNSRPETLRPARLAGAAKSENRPQGDGAGELLARVHSVPRDGVVRMTPWKRRGSASRAEGRATRPANGVGGPREAPPTACGVLERGQGSWGTSLYPRRHSATTRRGWSGSSSRFSRSQRICV